MASKTRGRPKGTEKPGDRQLLEAMARLIRAKKTMTPTAAAKRVVPEWNDTILRRLRDRWKKVGPMLLAEAGTRGETARTRPIASAANATTAASEAVARYTRALERSGVLSALDEYRSSPTLRALRELQNSMGLRAIRDYRNTASFRALEEAQRAMDAALGGFTARYR